MKQSETFWNGKKQCEPLAKHFSFYIGKLLTITKARENSIQFAIRVTVWEKGRGMSPSCGRGAIVELYLADVAGSRAHEIYAQPHPLSDFETLWQTAGDQAGRTPLLEGFTVRQWSKTNEQRGSISSQHINTNRYICTYISYVLWDGLTSWQTCNLT